MTEEPLRQEIVLADVDVWRVTISTISCSVRDPQHRGVHYVMCHLEIDVTAVPA